MNDIKIEVRERNEETGEIEFAGWLNKIEINFLLQYAINNLMAQGVIFDLKKEQEEGSEEMRIQIPNNATIQWTI